MVDSRYKSIVLLMDLDQKLSGRLFLLVRLGYCHLHAAQLTGVGLLSLHSARPFALMWLGSISLRHYVSAEEWDGL